MSRGRAFIFVINNWTEEDWAFVSTLFYTHGCKYLVCGKEIAPTTLTPHLQGYVYWKNARQFNAIVNLHPTWHLELAKGTAAQNRKYCTKENNFIELGESPLTPSDGAKMTNQERWTLAKEGRFEELDPENIKTYEYIHAKYQEVEDIPVLNNIWIYGPSGCGKSSKVRQDYDTFYTKGMSKWWDGYNQEEVVLLDDFDPNHGSYLSYYLKIWADHYAFNAEVKGGMLRARPKVIIVTSQYTIEQCFRLKDGSPDQPTIDAISRRFKRLNHSGFFGQFVDPTWNGNPFPALAPGFVPPPEPATQIPEDLGEDELLELLGDL